jgi:hypothetical protein
MCCVYGNTNNTSRVEVHNCGNVHHLSLKVEVGEFGGGGGGGGGGGNNPVYEN